MVVHDQVRSTRGGAGGKRRCRDCFTEYRHMYSAYGPAFGWRLGGVDVSVEKVSSYATMTTAGTIILSLLPCLLGVEGKGCGALGRVLGIGGRVGIVWLRLVGEFP